MSGGGYQAPSADFSPTGFGSDSPEVSARNGSSSNIANPPLFGIDYKRCASEVKTLCACGHINILAPPAFLGER